MCVIYACYSGVPTERELEQGAFLNGDGAGVCWIENFNTKDARVRWKKGLASDAKEVLKVIEENKLTPPFGIHFRTASIGGKCAELTHPFPVDDVLSARSDGTTRRVLMHNGHIQKWKDWFFPIAIGAPDFEIPIGPWSDSRALAAAAALKGEGVLDFIMEGSRVMILDSIPSSGLRKDNPRSYIRLYGNWIDRPNLGYEQSCETFRESEWERRGGKGHHDRDQRSKCLIPVISGKKSDGNGPSGGGSGSREMGAVGPPVTEVKPIQENCWTVDELEGLIKELRREQDEARVLLGC